MEELLHKAAKLFTSLFTWRSQSPVPGYDADVFRRVWQTAFDSATEADPEEIAVELGLSWTEREAAEWGRHCKRCASCGAWMYDPLTDHCHRCRDW